MEDHSGLVLDWFFLDWVGTTKGLDYAVKSVEDQDGKAVVSLENKDQRPMPSVVMVTYKDGTKERFYIPLRVMRGNRTFRDGIKTTNLPDWPWTHPDYSFTLEKGVGEISEVVLDPTMGMVDIDYTNNSWNNN